MLYGRCATDCPWADGLRSTSVDGMPARGPSTHVAAAGGRPARTPWGEPTAVPVTAEQTGGAFSMTTLSLLPGWRRPSYVHHRQDECFVVLAGSVRFLVEDRDHPVDAVQGDTVYVPRGLARSAELLGTEPARLLLLQTPAPTEPAPHDRSDAWLEGVELLDA